MLYWCVLKGKGHLSNAVLSLKGVDRMNKRELIAQVSLNAKLSNTDATHAVDTVLASIREALVKGQTVALTGFGTFSVTRRAERIGRNPKTGEKVTVPASRQAKFRPSKILKDAVK